MGASVRRLRTVPLNTPLRPTITFTNNKNIWPYWNIKATRFILMKHMHVWKKIHIWGISIVTWQLARYLFI